MEISQKRYNAFVIRYRIGSQQKATEDLAAAITYIFKNAATLGVGTDGYSLWGGSAGARMVGKIAGHGFGLENGTDAEGWLSHAVKFWEKHLDRSFSR